MLLQPFRAWYRYGNWPNKTYEYQFVLNILTAISYLKSTEKTQHEKKTIQILKQTIRLEFYLLLVLYVLPWTVCD